MLEQSEVSDFCECTGEDYTSAAASLGRILQPYLPDCVVGRFDEHHFLMKCQCLLCL